MDKAEEILSKHTGEEGVYLTKGLIRGSDALEAMEEYAIYYHSKQVESGSADVSKEVCPKCGDKLMNQVNSTNKHCVRCGETIKAE